MPRWSEGSLALSPIGISAWRERLTHEAPLNGTLAHRRGVPFYTSAL